MSWTDQKQQFIESAARTMWADAWAAHVENTCRLCGLERDNPGALHNFLPSSNSDAHAFVACWNLSGMNVMDAAPRTPQYALLSAAEFLGMLEQANGAGLAIIIKAASDAEQSRADRHVHLITTRNSYACGADQKISTDLGNYSTDINDVTCNACGEAHEQACGDEWETVGVDVAELASDTIMEAIGHGVSWTDDHESVMLPDPENDSCAWCGFGRGANNHNSSAEECNREFAKHGRACDHPEEHHAWVPVMRELIVPSYEFEYQSEAGE